MNVSFDNHSLIRNILIQKDRQEENSIKAIKENKKNTQQTESILLMGFKIKSTSKQTKSK
jgi:hypothetical protein